ncbi:MAG: hypothetical protein ABIA92_04680 [Patescibacteria group bacterium]
MSTTEAPSAEKLYEAFERLPIELQKVVFAALNALHDHFDSEELQELIPRLLDQEGRSREANYCNRMNARICWQEKNELTIEQEAARRHEQIISAMAQAIDECRSKTGNVKPEPKS